MKGLMIRFYSWMIARKEGATAVEYALIVAAIAVVIIAVVIGLGTQIQTVFTRITDALAPLVAAPPA